MAKQTGAIAPVNAMEKITKTGIVALKKITGDIGKLKVIGDQLTISGVDDTSGYKLVDEHRKAVKNIRTAIERKRKELNEPALKFQRDVNAAAKEITEKLSPIEDSMAAKLKVIDDEKVRVASELARKTIDRTNSLYKRGMTFNGEFFSYKDHIMYPEKIKTFTDEEWSHWINVVDLAIQADKIEEPIFPVGAPEPQQNVQPTSQEQPVPFKQVIPVAGSEMKPVLISETEHIPLYGDPDYVAPSFGQMEFTPTVTTFKGLLCEVYRAVNFPDCTLNGASSKHAKLLLIGPGIPEIHTETNPERVVKLEFIQAGAIGAIAIDGTPVRVKVNHPYVKPMSIDPGVGSQFGGNFIHTSDSRFPSDQPIAIHDRVETGVYDGR